MDAAALAAKSMVNVIRRQLAAVAAQVISMGRTHTQILLHVVFSTKNRQRFLTGNVTERMYAYMGGIIRDEGATLLAAGGVDDHVHLLIQMRTDITLSNLMRVVKAKSSRWTKGAFTDQGEFGWQEGYAAFSVRQYHGLRGIRRCTRGCRPTPSAKG